MELSKKRSVGPGQILSDQLYRPLILLMKSGGGTHGVDDGTSFLQQTFGWHLIPFLALHLYVLHYCLRCGYNNPDETIIVTVLECLKMWGGLLIAYNFRGKACSFRQLFNKLDQPPLYKEEPIHVGNNIQFALMIFGGYMVIRCLNDFIKVSSLEGLQHYANSYWYRTDVSENKMIFMFAAMLDCSLARFLMTTSILTGVFGYAIIAGHIRLKYTILNDELKKLMYKRTITSTQDLMETRGRLADLAMTINNLDDVFSFMAFDLFMLFIVCCCVSITYCICNFYISFIDEFYELNRRIDNYFLYVTFFVVGWSASKSCEESSGSILSVYHLTAMHPGWDTDFAIQGKLLVSQLTASNVKMTAWKFFDINRNVTLTVFTVLLTYLLLMVQLNTESLLMLGNFSTEKDYILW